MPVPQDGSWTYLDDIGSAGVITYYRIKGYEGNYTIQFYGAPATGHNIVVHYISDNWMANAAGTLGSEYTADTDVLLFPRELTEMGIVWRFRERRGLSYSAEFNRYIILAERWANDGDSRRTVNFGSKEYVKWTDVIPAWIPAS